MPCRVKGSYVPGQLPLLRLPSFPQTLRHPTRVPRCALTDLFWCFHTCPCNYRNTRDNLTMRSTEIGLIAFCQYSFNAFVLCACFPTILSVLDMKARLYQTAICFKSVSVIVSLQLSHSVQQLFRFFLIACKKKNKQQNYIFSIFDFQYLILQVWGSITISKWNYRRGWVLPDEAADSYLRYCAP